MQSYWPKALATISGTLIISVSLAGCGDNNGTSTSTGGGTSPGGGTLSTKLEIYLHGIESELDTRIGLVKIDRSLALAHCIYAQSAQVRLQDLINRRYISASNKTFVRISSKNTELRNLSCAN